MEIARPPVIVVDTNVIAYLWLRGDFTPAAEAALSGDADWAVPVLWRSEFRSVLTAAIRSRRLTLDAAIAIAKAAEEQFHGREFAVDSADVLALSTTSGCSAYDCEFVALATSLALPLVTNDRDVVRAFPHLAVALSSFATGRP
jgi:predicted nucleic acid-binding protein